MEVWQDAAFTLRFRVTLVYNWDIRVLLPFLASFLQESALLHGWIEHALLPPDYMDLSGIFINSSAAARVCATLQTQNAAHNSQRDRFVKREEERRGQAEGMRRGRRSVIDKSVRCVPNHQYHISTSLLINFTRWPFFSALKKGWFPFPFPLELY